MKTCYKCKNIRSFAQHKCAECGETRVLNMSNYLLALTYRLG